MIKCNNCGWTGYETSQSWAVDDSTVDEPFGICPSCRSGDIEEIEEEEDEEDEHA